MESTLGWMEIAPAALRRMRQQLEDEGDGVVDEMGVLALHSGYADRFFPGTSVLHRRPRYLFFTCWNYLALAAQGEVTARNVRARKEQLEHWLTDQLRKSAQEGIIGIRVFPRPPAQPPDAVYWTALRTFGFYRGADRGALLEGWDREGVRAAGKALSRAAEPTDDDDALAIFHVPPVPRNWGGVRQRAPITFDLEPEEAEFLFERLSALETCLLSEATKLAKAMRPAADAPWKDELLLEAAEAIEERQRLLRTQAVSALGQVVRGVYGALVEQLHVKTLPIAERKALEAPEHYRGALERLWSDGTVETAAQLELDALQEDLPNLRRTFVSLLSETQERLRRPGRPAAVIRTLLEPAMHDVYEAVERERKGAARARLADTPAGLARRQGFAPGTVRVYGLDFRWAVVKRMLQDLHKGLQE